MNRGPSAFEPVVRGVKKLDNHIAAIALHDMHYNFCRVHQTLRVTPAMEAGIADHVWSIKEIVALLGMRESAVA
jgi:hypothetical protein